MLQPDRLVPHEIVASNADKAPSEEEFRKAGEEFSLDNARFRRGWGPKIIKGAVGGILLLPTMSGVPALDVSGSQIQGPDQGIDSLFPHSNIIQDLVDSHSLVVAASVGHEFVTDSGLKIPNLGLNLAPETQIRTGVMLEGATGLDPFFFTQDGISYRVDNSASVGIGENEGKVRRTTTLTIRNLSNGRERYVQARASLFNPVDYGYREGESIDALGVGAFLVDAQRDRIYLLGSVLRNLQIAPRGEYIPFAIYLPLSRLEDFSTQRRFDFNSTFTSEVPLGYYHYFREVQENSGIWLETRLLVGIGGVIMREPMYRVRIGNDGDPIPPIVRAADIPRPTESPTPEPLMTVGGRDFMIKMISSGIRFDWTSGNRETLDLLARFASGETTILPPVPVTPNSPMSSIDTSPRPGGLNCYALIPVREQPLGISNVYCTFPFIRSATGAPQEFSMRFTGSNSAELSWQRGGPEVTDYVVIPVGGGDPFIVPAAQNRVPVNFSGARGYIVVARNSRGEVLGNTDILFGITNISTLESSNSHRK
ncbi:MAG: hypothetical protein G01um10147_1117 [Microgenomates group bacterium Gr01-1014_7]|nr:MAG: hypothetical protein G01um10147_1117 [Microgenomates group bacterium Gr01-1014_7]